MHYIYIHTYISFIWYQVHRHLSHPLPRPYMCICKGIYMYVCMYIYIDTFKCTFVDINTYTYMYAPPQPPIFRTIHIYA